MGKVTYNIDTTLVKDMTISEIGSLAMKINKAGGSKSLGIDIDLGISVVFVARLLRKYRFSNAGFFLTYERLHNIVMSVSDEYISIHRLNYFCYFVLQNVYDWLDEKKMLTINAKLYFGKIERVFKDYQTSHKALCGQASFATVQDHVRLAFT